MTNSSTTTGTAYVRAVGVAMISLAIFTMGPLCGDSQHAPCHTYPPFIVPPHTPSPSLFHSQLTDLMVVIQAMPPLYEA